MFPARPRTPCLGGHAYIATFGGDNADGEASALVLIRRARYSMTDTED